MRPIATGPDIEKSRRLRDLQDRLEASLFQTSPGFAGPEVIAEHEAILAGLEELRAEGLPPSIQPDWLLTSIGEAQSRIASMCSWLGETGRSKVWYERAARTSEERGRLEMASFYRERIAAEVYREKGDVDDEARRLLEALERKPLEYCQTLADLGGLYFEVGDLFAAEERMNAALDELGRLGYSPAPEDVIQKELEKFMADLGAGRIPGSGSRSSILLEVNGLYQQIHRVLADIQAKRHPERSREHSGRVDEALGPELGEDVLRERLWSGLSARGLPATPPELGPGFLDETADELRRLIEGEELEAKLGEDFRKLFDQGRAHGEWEKQFREMNEATQQRRRQRLEAFSLEGFVDPARLRQKLDRLNAEHLQRGADEPQDDLLARMVELEAEARRVRNPELHALSLLRKAEILRALQRDGEALSDLFEARKVLGSLSRHTLGIFILGSLAEVLAGRGEWEEVSALAEEGIPIVESQRARVSAPYLQSAFLQPRISIYSLGVRAAHQLGRPEQMLERADLSKCQSVLGYFRQVRVPVGGPGETERAFRRVSERIDEAAATGNVPEDLRRSHRALWDRLFIERAEARAAPAEGFDLAAVRATLAADEAVLYYYWIDRLTLLLAVLDREGMRHEVRVLTPDHRKELEELTQNDLGRMGNREIEPHRQQRPEPLQETLKRLSGALLPAPEALTGKRRLLVSPHRLLHAVPFHALRWEGDFLLRRFALTYVPNLGSLLLRNPPAGPPRLLAVATQESTLGTQPLPMVEREVDEVAATWTARRAAVTLLKAGAATKQRLRDLAAGELRSFTCLHVATHGSNVLKDTPMESSLVLYDAALDGTEIATWSLGADLVVLSACWSGKRPTEGRGLDELPGDEMFGLQAAFFAAGARRVLGALWPADDQAAFEIMTCFHRHWAAGQGPEVALQSATLEWIDAKGAQADLSRWAPFHLVALGRPAQPEGLRGRSGPASA